MNSNLHQLFSFCTAVRSFFNKNDFLDVLAPPVVSCPGLGLHIHPFKVSSVFEDPSRSKTQKYLHTSPEFYMKFLLSKDFNKIFTIGHSFRDEPDSPNHRSQFLMLEWYRTQSYYHDIINDVRELLSFLSNQYSWKIPTLEITTISDLFTEHLKINVLEYQEDYDLYDYVHKMNFNHLLPSTKLVFDDCFFHLFLNHIEPILKNHPAIIIDKYPEKLKSLATISKENPLTSDRFELYLEGIEIANCYNELLDPAQQTTRANDDIKKKEEIYQYKTPFPKQLISSLEKKLPPSAGIALGLERLFHIVSGNSNVFTSDSTQSD